MAKKAVHRRVALWRAQIVDGERQVLYVTIAGDALPKSGKAFRTAGSEQRFLKGRGIVTGRPLGSSIEHPEELPPYAEARRGTGPRDLAHWCVPETVVAAYRDTGVRQLHAWQAKCLEGPGVLDGRSIVYVAPTSAGKSLVAEVIMLRQLLFRGRRALLVLPYVSICQEKVEHLRKLWAGCGVRVEALYAASEGRWHHGADVAVCTIEKANALLNRLLEEDPLLRDIGTIVVDELHILGDEGRGYQLELILAKARLSAQRAAPGDPGRALQVVGLSATLPNVQVLADWLDAYLHVSDDRPVPLSLSIASKGQIVEQADSSRVAPSLSQVLVSQPAAGPAPAPLPARPQGRDPDGLMPLVWESVSDGHGVLLFCATKDWCEKAAAMLAEELPAERPQEQANADAGTAGDAVAEIQDARLRAVEELRQVPAGLCPVLAKTLPRGVAYHHAGLTVEERVIIEEAFRTGTLSCLCATSTLAAGVNLPARRVIIRSMRIGTDALDATRFRQMAGRAGRTGLDTQGECVVMTTTGKDLETARALFASELCPLRSSLHGFRLARAVLEAVCLGLARTVGDLLGSFAGSLLRYHEVDDEGNPGAAALVEDIRGSLRYLESLHLLQVEPQRPRQQPTLPPALAADSSGSGAAGTDGDSLAPAAGRTVARVNSAEDLLAMLDSGPQAQPAEPAVEPEAPAVCEERAAVMATPLGDGVVYSGVRPAEAMAVFEDLQRARPGVHLDTDLHLVYLATPLQEHLTFSVDWGRFLSMYERLSRRDRAVADAVGVSHRFLVQESMGRRGPVGLPKAAPGQARLGERRLERERSVVIHGRFFGALALCELIAGRSLARVATGFGIPRGHLQAMQSQAAASCSMVRMFCERLRWHEMAALFESLLPRLNFGITADALPLCKVSGVFPARARALFEAGFKTAEDLARAPVAKVEVVLRLLHQFESHCNDAGAARRQEQVVRQAAKRIVAAAQEHIGAQLQEIEDEAEDERRRVEAALGASASASGKAAAAQPLVESAAMARPGGG